MKPAHIKAPHDLIKANLKRSFTLIELLIIIAILGILAAAVLVAINPGKRMAQAKVSGALRFAKQIENSLGFEAVGQWNFDECSGTQAKDTSVNTNNNGNITGATYELNDTPYHIVGSGTGKCALSFNGAGNVNIPVSDSLKFGMSSFTIASWVKLNAVPPDYGIPFNNNRNPSWVNTKFSGVSEGNNGNFGYELYDGVNYIAAYGPAPKLGDWYHYVLIIDRASGKTKVYINGSLESSMTRSLGSLGDLTSNGPFYLAALLNGLIDDVHIYASALSKTEIQQLYTQTAPKYSLASLQDSFVKPD